MRRIIFSTTLLAICFIELINQTTLAQNNDNDTIIKTAVSLSEFKLQPRVNVWGITGSNTIGQSQILIPFYGDQNRALLGLVEGNIVTHDNTWLIGSGLIYRQIVNDRIYGGYLIADHNRSSKNNGFWIANPGLEILGKIWDFHFNAYIPISNNKQNYCTVKWGEDFGISDYIQYEGHKSYDRYLQRQDFETAAHGVDFKVGWNIPLSLMSLFAGNSTSTIANKIDADSDYNKKAKIYLGGYHFKIKSANSSNNTNDINGVSAKLTYELNPYVTFDLTHTYDNYNRHRTFGGIKLTLGGYSEKERHAFGILSRLLDPIEHGYGATIVPIKQVIGTTELVDHERRLRHDNLWFITKGVRNDSSDVVDDGTYEHPFSSFDPAVLNYIKAHSSGGASAAGGTGNIGAVTKHPMLYFASGTYSLAAFSGIAGRPYKLQLPTGWGIYGRSADYKHQTNGDERPVLVGGIDLGSQESSNYGVSSVSVVEGGENTIDSIMLRAINYATAKGEAILRVINAHHIILNNVKIGDNNPGASSSGYDAGIYMENAGISLRNVDIYNYNRNQYDDKSSYGIYATNATVNFVDGINNINVSNSQNKQTAIGIELLDRSTLNFQGGVNNINVESLALGFPLEPAAYGIVVQNASMVNFKGGATNINVVDRVGGLSPTATAIGITANYDSTINFQGGANRINTGAAIAHDASGEYFMANAVAMEINNGSIVNFQGGYNIINATSSSLGFKSSAESIGLIAIDNSILNFQGGTNIINASSVSSGISQRANSLGIKVDDYSALNFTGGENSVNSYAKFTASNGSSYHARAIGIDLFNEARVNFIGGTNSINVLSAGDENQIPPIPYTMLYEATGINAYGANINFSGGINNFTAVNIINGDFADVKASAHGIAAYSSNLNFETDAGGKININVGVINKNQANNTHNDIATVYGIYADEDSHLSIKGSEELIKPLKNILKYVTVTSLSNQYTEGNKIRHGDNIIPWLAAIVPQLLFYRR